MLGATFSPKEAFLGLGFLFLGCATPDEKLTPAQYIEKNSSVLEQLRSYKESERQEGIERFQRLGREQGGAIILYVLSDPKLNDYRLEVVLARIRVLSDQLEDPISQFAVRFGLWRFHASRADLGRAEEMAADLLAFAESRQDPELLLGAYLIRDVRERHDREPGPGVLDAS